MAHSRPGELSLLASPGTGLRHPPAPAGNAKASSQAALAELCRQQVMEAYAPAAVLIDDKYNCLYSLGPTDRYLRLAPGYPSFDLLAMAPQGLRTKLRSAIQLAGAEDRRVVVAGGRREADGSSMAFNIEVRPVPGGAEQLLLVGFIDQPRQEAKRGRSTASRETPRIAELEHELEATRAEFEGAIRSLEVSAEEQKAINEEALSVNEEYQSTNEELLTSKEELQSLNEELTALNGQLQETLERQRTTSNDLQNILYSTDVATIFLDPDLRIRYFTPATRSLFNVIPGDVGRPLSDLNSLAADGDLLTDAASVLKTQAPIEREIEARTGAWYVRRILPYRTEDNGAEGVVITFVDISERKRTADALEVAERQAQLANAAKSRFLAAASHDLRQPLQALSLMRGILERKIRRGQTEEALALVARLDETSVAMTGMLNTMLDINQIEAGIVTAKPIDFAIAPLFDRLRDEFSYHAQAKGLILRVVSSSAVVHSDPHLLEQMIRNLLSNALKYTEHGKVLLGCRRRGNRLRIEICDSGIGVPEDARQAIFDEYHQLDNPVRERSRGLGLGLAIVQRLADLLGHRVEVHSEAGRGSIFAIEVELAEEPADPVLNFRGAPGGTEAPHAHHGTILIVEDDPDVRDLLAQLLADEGYRTLAAPDGIAALELVERGKARPDLLLTDYNLPNGCDGLELGTRLRRQLHKDIPIVVLTGDISTDALRRIAQSGYGQLSKPVDPTEMLGVIEHQLASTRCAQIAPTAAGAAGEAPATVFVVDDDAQVGAALRATLEGAGCRVEVYPSCEAFLAAYRPGRSGCLLLDAYLPGMDGLALLRRLGSAGDRLPAIMITGNSDVPMAVAAMKAGAFDFIEKPIGGGALLESIERAMDHARDGDKLAAWRESAARHVAGLTARERQIMDLVLAGQPSKNIAADLGISQRTVENHRAAVMRKTGSKSLPALARLALAAAWKGVAPVDPGAAAP
jgi:two-component system CheB/CheR fusion protein